MAIYITKKSTEKLEFIPLNNLISSGHQKVRLL